MDIFYIKNENKGPAAARIGIKGHAPLSQFLNSSFILQLRLKSKNYNLIDSAVLINNDLQISLCEYENKIKEEEKTYVELLEQMKRYEQKLQINTERVKNVLKQKGLSEVRDQIVLKK